MNKQFPGILIRMERFKKNWSQSGLCQGICAVSYLSKIEQGKADPSPEIVHLLLNRLGVIWYDDDSTVTKAGNLIEQLYTAVFSYDGVQFKIKLKELEENWNLYSNGPYMIDCLLIKNFDEGKVNPALKNFESCFDHRQQVLWLILNECYDELIQLSPTAYSFYCYGYYSYKTGNYPLALEQLQRSYNLAAEQGLVYIMLESRMLMGNCYSNTLEHEKMLEHYQVAERLATAIKDETTIETIRYNIASTELEMGRIKESYQYFSQLENHTILSLHKLAVCCEKLKKYDEAINALDKAKELSLVLPPSDINIAICDLVRYRLEHQDYLKDNTYGKMLITTFNRIRKELPSGYVVFHLPWMLEWYIGKRQYKQAYELIAEFSSYQPLKLIK